MMRARSIKPGLFANELLAQCDIWARFIFPGLWMVADREGRLEDRPMRLKAELLPYDGANVDSLLQQLADHGFIVRYAVDDLRLIQITNFSRHQYPHHKEPPSRLPPPPGWPPQKPEAHRSSDATEAQDKPQAGPGFDTLRSDVEQGRTRAESGFRTPDSLNLIPDDRSAVGADGPRDPPASTSQAKKTKVTAAGKQAKSSATWEAYRTAFVRRYGVEPTRGAAVSAHLCRLVDAVGADEAPRLAAFYVGCEDTFYLQRAHPADILVRDALKLRVQLLTGKPSLVPNRQLQQQNRQSRHSGFDQVDYSAGVGPNGEVTS